MGEPLSSVFRTDGTLISASAAPHCRAPPKLSVAIRMILHYCSLNSFFRVTLIVIYLVFGTTLSSTNKAGVLKGSNLKRIETDR